MNGPTFQEYQKKWPQMFEDEKQLLKSAFGSTAIAIYHVGSTSIPGMPGKGIIDILITVESLEPNEEYSEPLKQLGYIRRPVPERPESPFFTKPSVKPRTYNVHIALEKSQRERSMLAFRDYLIQFPSEAKRYENAKRKLAESRPNDWEFYSTEKLKIAGELTEKAVEWRLSTYKLIKYVEPDEIYVSFDIEADGPIPGEYSMLSVGMCIAGWTESGRYHAAEPCHSTIYLEIKPISNNFLPEALKVNGLDRDEISRNGLHPIEAVKKLKEWFQDISKDRNLVLVAYPSTFDWPFLSYYFHKYTNNSPPINFTRICDLRTLIVAKSRSLYYTPTRKCLPDELMPIRKQKHHGLEDAMEQAQLFSSVQIWSG